MEARVIIQAFAYILSKVGSATKLKLLKLLYLADKYHLIRYGRTVSGDNYCAMKHGPVASTAYNILKFDDFHLSDDIIEETMELIEEHEKDTYKLKVNADALDNNMLSETDLEALDFVLHNFGKKSGIDLSKYTHNYPEWKQYKVELEEQIIKSMPLDTAELFSVLGEKDPLYMPNEHISDSRQIFSGSHD